MNAAGVQGGTTANIHRTYEDLYADPAWDPFVGNYTNMYHEYMLPGLAPATLRDILYNSGNAGTPIHLLAHIRDANALDDDPGYIIGYHRLTRHVVGFGQLPRPFDGQGHAFMGDIVNGQVPTSVLVPDQAFDLLQVVQVPTIGRLDQLLQAEPEADVFGPFVAGEQDVVEVVSRGVMVVPNIYLRPFLTTGMRPREAYTTILGLVQEHGNEISCEPLLEWLCLTLTRRAANALPCTVMPPLQASVYAPPAMHQHFLEYRLAVVHRDLPLLSPAAHLDLPSLFPAGQQQGAQLIVTGLYTLVQEQRLARQEAMEQRQIRDAPGEYFPVDDESELPPLHEEMDNAPKSRVWEFIQKTAEDCLANHGFVEGGIEENHREIQMTEKVNEMSPSDSAEEDDSTPVELVAPAAPEELRPVPLGEVEEKVQQGPPKKQSIMQAATSKALRPFVIISSSYLLFTITDGAIRMIVLLHAYNKAFSALEVSIMFTLYELAGVVTNLAAGFLGAKWGIKFTLTIGLTLQLFAYGLLFGWQDDWTKEQAIIYVTISQMFAGIAKDLTKLGGKTVTKLVTPDEQETKLFKLVSLITGWKNSLKGVGYFIGSALIQFNYYVALGAMMGLVLLAMPWAILGLDRSLGTAKKKNASWREVFKMDNTNLNWLSLARLFLFASRDFWFEVPLPFFLRSPSCDGLGEDFPCTSDENCVSGAICGDQGFCENLNVGGGCGGLGVERFIVGAFLGGYIILYGQVQSWTPQLVTGPLKQTPPNKYTEILWGLINCLPTLAMWIVMTWSTAYLEYELTQMTIWLVVMLVMFAVIFAVNSSIHSYLVVSYASKDKVAVSVGFYYMSNAVGRLLGTLGSGVLYTYIGEDNGEYAGTDAVAGLAACFLAGTLSSLLAALITVMINDNKSGLKCGCLTIIPATVTPESKDGNEAKKEEESPPCFKENEKSEGVALC